MLWQVAPLREMSGLQVLLLGGWGQTREGLQGTLGDF